MESNISKKNKRTCFSCAGDRHQHRNDRNTICPYCGVNQDTVKVAIETANRILDGFGGKAQTPDSDEFFTNENGKLEYIDQRADDEPDKEPQYIIAERVIDLYNQGRLK